MLRFKNLRDLEFWKKLEGYNKKEFKMDKLLNKYPSFKKMKKEQKKEKRFLKKDNQENSILKEQKQLLKEELALPKVLLKLNS
jgi:uncharacterized protein YktA (UPF0223 family)